MEKIHKHFLFYSQWLTSKLSFSDAERRENASFLLPDTTVTYVAMLKGWANPSAVLGNSGKKLVNGGVKPSKEN